MLFGGLGQQADGTSSRRDFKPKFKHYKHLKMLLDAWCDGETINVILVFRKSKEHIGKLLSIYHGNGTGDEAETQEEEEDDGEQDDSRDNRTWGPNNRASSTGNRQTSNERPTQGTHATGRGDSGNRRHASPGRSHVGQRGNTHGDSDCRDAPNKEPLTRCDDTQAGHSRAATAMATAFEPLNRSLETFLTRLSRTNERREKSRRVFKKPRCYKDESDGCIDIWLEVMKLHFEEEDLSERQECSALTSNLEEPVP